MKSFFEWFKPELRLNRWYFIILMGIMLMVYSVSSILVENTPEISTIVIISILFIIGFLLIMYAIINIQKRTLEIFIEANGVSTKTLKDKDINVKSLIFDKNIYENGPKVLVIGGGTGLNSVIAGVKKYTNNISAIVTLSDYSEDKSRKELNLLPYRDIKESIAALSDKEGSMRRLLDLEFSNERLKGLNFGDVYLLAMQELYGNVSTSIKKSTDILNITGEVIPVSLDEITVCAELTDGTIVESKEEIPKVVMDKIEAIKRIYVKPTNSRPTPGAIEAIKDADIIVIGPGNLYTNVIPNLLVKSISKEIKDSKALKVYVSNIMTDQGQTDGYTLSDHIRAIFDHAGGKIFDYCIADTGEIIPEYIRNYNLKGEDVVVVDENEVKKLGVKLIQKDLSNIITDGKIRHDSDTIAVVLMDILMNEMKYSGNDDVIKNVVLESVLKEQKRLQKRKEKNLKNTKNREREKDNSQNTKKKESKFSEKYKERFNTIREIDKKKINEESNKELFTTADFAQNQEDIEKNKQELYDRTKSIVEEKKEEDLLILENKINKEAEEQKLQRLREEEKKKIALEANKESTKFSTASIKILSKDFNEERKQKIAERQLKELEQSKKEEKRKLEQEKALNANITNNKIKEEEKEKETKTEKQKEISAQAKIKGLLEELNKLEESRMRLRRNQKQKDKE